MSLTHEQIAAMTCVEVNEAIYWRIATLYCGDEPPNVSYKIYDYCHEWSHAGRLLEMMAGDKPIIQYTDDGWFCVILGKPTPKTTIGVLSPTAPEAIARCWLEWWEVTHD